MEVVELEDASEALERARPFLTARPVEHNLLLTIIDQSIEFSLGGTFWLVVDDSEVVGFAKTGGRCLQRPICRIEMLCFSSPIVPLAWSFAGGDFSRMSLL